jgi:hypothetical protein
MGSFCLGASMAGTQSADSRWSIGTFFSIKQCLSCHILTLCLWSNGIRADSRKVASPRTKPALRGRLTPIEPPHSSEQSLFLGRRCLLASVATGVSVADTSLFEIDLPTDERIEVSSCDPDRGTTHGLSLQCPLYGAQSATFLQAITVPSVAYSAMLRRESRLMQGVGEAGLCLRRHPTPVRMQTRSLARTVDDRHHPPRLGEPIASTC